MALESFISGRVTDGFVSIVESVGAGKVIFWILLVLLIQSVRTSISNVVFNDLLGKTLTLLIKGARQAGRIIFVFYDFVVYHLSTEWLFAWMDWHVQKKVVPNFHSILLLFIGYICTYMVIIQCYIGSVSLLFGYSFFGMVTLLSLFLAIILMFWNLESGIANFSDFLALIDELVEVKEAS